MKNFLRQFIEQKIPQFYNFLQNSFLKSSHRFYLYRHTEMGLIITSMVIGIAIGFSIVLFHWVVSSFDSFFSSFHYMAEDVQYIQFLVFPLIAGFGGLLVGILNHTAFKNLRADGIPFVIHAINFKQGVLPFFLSVRAIINSALSIATGGGAGREAPTVLLGASVGSGLGQFFNLSSNQLKLLAASGAAAAIAGIFNAPLGGIVFALEIIIGTVSIQSFVPIVIASVMSTATARFFLGNQPILVDPPNYQIFWFDYFIVIILAVIAGLVSVYYLKTFHSTKIFVKRKLLKLHPILKPAIGGLGAGLLLAMVPYLLETNYEPINTTIVGEGVWFLALATILLKPISNAITLGSGGEGGTFAPSMKTGAMVGFLFGLVLTYFLPETNIGIYALMGAAALISGTYLAPLTGTIIIFEISRNYGLILPIMMVSVISIVIVRRFNVRSFNPLQFNTFKNTKRPE